MSESSLRANNALPELIQSAKELHFSGIEDGTDAMFQGEHLEEHLCNDGNRAGRRTMEDRNSKVEKLR